MLRTITIGSSISVQGILLRQNHDGTLVVTCDGKSYTGQPVPSHAALEAIKLQERTARAPDHV